MFTFQKQPLKTFPSKVLAMISLGCLFTLTACGAGDSPEAIPSANADTESASHSPAQASPTEGVETFMKLEQRDLSHQTTNVDAFSVAQLPLLSGAKPEVADAFSSGVEELLVEQLKFVAEKSEDYWPIPKEYCQQSPNNLCGSEVRFDVKKHGIHENHATVSYTASYNLAGGTSNEDVLSLTINLDTGRIASLGDFTGNFAGVVAEHAPSGTCFENYASASNRPAPEAFSPTQDGLYLGWSMATFSTAACGSASLTIPWDALEGQNNKTKPAPSPSDKTGSAKAAKHTCATAKLPEGIDPRVCGTSTDGAQKLVADEYGSAWVMTASNNIWCDIYAGELGCTRMELYGRFSLKQTGAATKADYDDGPPASEPVIMSYGQPVTINGFTCLPQEIGVSCWNLESGHGMFLSRSKTVLW